MKVKMLKLSAGPQGILHPGDLVEVDDNEAKLLVLGGYAERNLPECEQENDDGEHPTEDSPSEEAQGAKHRGSKNR